ncbi:MAG: putative ABC transport system permease protein [Planctomycetota bacterium]|jgi:putative ABC transport system permease protein
MKHSLLLAWRHIFHTKLRSAILVACVTLAFLLPFSISGLVNDYGDRLVKRSRATPIVAGALGSRFDLVLSSLYFTGRVPRSLSMREANELIDTGFTKVVPIVLGQTARSYPLVGTTPDYFEERRLVVADGCSPLLLGEAMIGSDVAKELQLGVGSTLLTDEGSLYDLSLRSPLKLQITGVLKPNGTSDDRAVFADTKTVWIGMGIGHGHVEAEAETENRVLGVMENSNGGADKIVMGAATFEFTEFTEENRSSFHFHGEAESYPVSAMLLFPVDARSATILKGRYRLSDDLQLLEPIDVVEELMGVVFQVKSFFDANSILVAVSTSLFLVLVLLLSIRVRHRELETLYKIGCARSRVVQIFGFELGLLVLLGLCSSMAFGVLVQSMLENVFTS